MFYNWMSDLQQYCGLDRAKSKQPEWQVTYDATFKTHLMKNKASDQFLRLMTDNTVKSDNDGTSIQILIVRREADMYYCTIAYDGSMIKFEDGKYSIATTPIIYVFQSLM